jgi:ubiquinone/menaquinone biosynthesis C-methylase UbiE
MPEEHTIEEVREYWNTYINDAEVVDAPLGSPEFFEALERYRYEKVDFLKDYVDFPRYRGKKVLEIGCGPGIDLLQFARAGAEVHARDLTENGVKLARANLAREGHEGDIRQGNAEELDVESESFDVYYSNGVLHHTVDIDKAIAEAHRVLRPDGEAIVMLYNRYSWFNLVATLSGTPVEHAEKDAPIVRRFSTRECRKLFRRFRDVEIYVDRFPKRTLKFDNLLAKLNNNVLVPFFGLLPSRIKRPFGWHIMIRSRKESRPARLVALIGASFDGAMTELLTVAASLGAAIGF